MTHIRIYKELRKAIAGCLAVMLLPLFTACEHKDLCYDHPHSASVEVVFDWTEAPDAHPATMSLYLYRRTVPSRCVTSSPSARAVPSSFRGYVRCPLRKQRQGDAPHS